MARINIEDDLYKDSRFFDLMMRLKSADLALGVLVRAWVTAQKWYVTPSKMIPEKEWKKQRLPEDLFEVGFAKRVDGFVYVSGSEQQFAWLEQRVHAGRKGGLKSGKQRRHSASDAALRHGARTVVNKAVKSGELIKPEFCQDCGFSGLIEGHHQDYSKPLEVMWLCKKCHTNTHRLLRNSKHIEANEAVASRNEAGVKQNEGNETLLSLPLSHSPSLSLFPTPPQKQNVEENTLRGRPLSVEKKSGKKTPLPPGATVPTRKAYEAAYKKRYGVEPVSNEATNSRLAEFIRRIGMEEGPAVAAFYVTHNAWKYTNAGHSVGLLLMDCEKLRTEWFTGRRNTSTESRQLDRKQSNANAFGPLLAEATAREAKERGNQHE